MKFRFANSLGDVAHAFDALRPQDHDTQRAILRVLGFDVQVEADVSAPVAFSRLPMRGKTEFKENRIEPEMDKPPRKIRPQRLESQQKSVEPTPLKPIGYQPPAGDIEWSDSSLELGGTVIPLYRREHQPLFKPGWEAGLLIEMLSAEEPLGPIDVDRLVEMFAALRPIEYIPRLPVRLLLRGIEVLVDRGGGMEPLLRDQEILVKRIETTVGSDAVTIRWFFDCPLHGAGVGAVHTWQSYAAPESGRTVLVLSDFGVIGARMTRSFVRDWIEFLSLLEGAHCPVIGLTPFPAHRLSSELTQRMTVVQWDRGTTTGEVRRGVKAYKRRLA